MTVPLPATPFLDFPCPDVCVKSTLCRRRSSFCFLIRNRWWSGSAAISSVNCRSVPVSISCATQVTRYSMSAKPGTFANGCGIIESPTRTGCRAAICASCARLLASSCRNARTNPPHWRGNRSCCARSGPDSTVPGLGPLGRDSWHGVAPGTNSSSRFWKHRTPTGGSMVRSGEALSFCAQCWRGFFGSLFIHS